MRPRAWLCCIALFTLGAALASAQTSACDPNVFYQVCTTSLSQGTLGASYGPETLVASIGYEGTNVWSLAAGSLPPGLTLTSDGVISGTPTTPGLFSFTVQADQAGSPPLSAQGQLSIFVFGSLQVTTTTLPPAILGVGYAAPQLTVTGGYPGVTPTWTASQETGSMPPGLSLSSDGTITGVPTTLGTFRFGVEAYESYPQYQGSAIYAYSTLSITIGPQLFQIVTTPLAGGTVGVPYSQTFTATGASVGGTLVWSLIGGALPPGLTLSSAGALTGTPAAFGSYTMLIQVVDQYASGGSIATVQLFNVSIAPASASLLITTPSSLPTAILGSPYSVQIVATGGKPGYTWTIDSGALPNGLSLDTAAGVISGTPSTAGDSSFQLTVTDQAGVKAARAFTLTVSSGISITTPAALPGGVAGTPYTVTLAATGGTSPYAWSVVSESGNLPPGLSLDATTGKLSGTPTASGNYAFTVAVADASQRTASKAMTLNIATALTISTASPLTGGTLGTAYQLQLTATGGTPSFTWSVTAGALPAGITLDPSSGKLAGTPTAAGDFSVTIGVKDAVQSATKAFTLTIAAPALPTVTITGLPDTGSPATQPGLGIGLSGAYTLDLTGHATLTFAPDSASDDPAVQFTSGGRSVDFTIAAGTTAAVFASPSLGVQTGTVSGTITITLQLFAAGADVTPSPAPTKVLRIPGAVPVITSATMTSTSTGFNLVVVGYSTTREVTAATVHLNAATGATLATADFNIPLTSAFTTWYQSTASLQYGSQFSLTIPFTVSSATSTISSSAITLTNSQGTSAQAHATF